MNAHALRVIFIAVLLAAAGAGTAGVKPHVVEIAAAPDIDAMLPDDFGPWRRAALSDAVLPPESDLGPGEAVAYRAYKDDLGRVVTLVVAYGPPLGDSVRLHRPEKCYAAQGFEILSRREAHLALDGRDVGIVNLETQGPARKEAVSYWLREGAGFSTRADESGWRRLRSGAGGLDGALVRVSSVYSVAPQFQLHAEFMSDLAAALQADGRKALLGSGDGA